MKLPRNSAATMKASEDAGSVRVGGVLAGLLLSLGWLLILLIPAPRSLLFPLLLGL